MTTKPAADRAMVPGILTPRPLTPEPFEPFGSVIDLSSLPGRPVNENRGLRCDLPIDLRHETTAGTPVSALYRLDASSLPFPVRQIERHPHSDQMFVPLQASSYLVAVAPADGQGRPDLRDLRTFVGHAGQVVIYRAGTWHLPLVALGGEGRFLMQMWETGDPALDCEVHDVTAPLSIGA